MIVAQRAHFPSANAASLPAITSAQMREVDRLAIDEFDILLEQMVEHAGASLAEVVRAEVGGDLHQRRVVIAVGPGNNGAGGLAAGRHLVNRGASVRVILAKPVNQLPASSQRQLATLLQMAVDCSVAVYDLADAEIEVELARADAAIDAVLGYGATGEPRDAARWLIDHLRRATAPIISLDLPSGVDADSGHAAEISVRAQATLTLALPKRGLYEKDGREHAGRLYLADLGLPAELYRRAGIEVDTPFARAAVLRLEH